eukprot:4782073-Amphidinium_carterae.1
MCRLSPPGLLHHYVPSLVPARQRLVQKAIGQTWSCPGQTIHLPLRKAPCAEHAMVGLTRRASKQGKSGLLWTRGTQVEHGLSCIDRTWPTMTTRWSCKNGFPSVPGQAIPSEPRLI